MYCNILLTSWSWNCHVGCASCESSSIQTRSNFIRCQSHHKKLPLNLTISQFSELQRVNPACQTSTLDHAKRLILSDWKQEWRCDKPFRVFLYFFELFHGSIFYTSLCSLLSVYKTPPYSPCGNTSYVLPETFCLPGNMLMCFLLSLCSPRNTLMTGCTWCRMTCSLFDHKQRSSDPVIMCAMWYLSRQ